MFAEIIVLMVPLYFGNPRDVSINDGVASGQIVSSEWMEIPGLSTMIVGPTDVVISGHVGLQVEGKRDCWSHEKNLIAAGVDILVDDHREFFSVENVDKKRHYYDASVNHIVRLSDGEHNISIRGKATIIYQSGDCMLWYKEPMYSVVTIAISR